MNWAWILKSLNKEINLSIYYYRKDRSFLRCYYEYLAQLQLGIKKILNKLKYNIFLNL